MNVKGRQCVVGCLRARKALSSIVPGAFVFEKDKNGLAFLSAVFFMQLKRAEFLSRAFSCHRQASSTWAQRSSER